VKKDVRQGDETVIPKDAVLHGRISRLPLIDGHRYIDFQFRYFDWTGVRAEIGGRRNELSFHDDGFFKGVARMPTPIPGEGERVRLPAGYQLFLKSSAVSSTTDKLFR
jgi:hypothetical protein